MDNYQLGPVIGKLGGVEVQKIPVDIVASGSSGSVVVMHTVHVPEGETWLVVLSGDFDPNSDNVTHRPDVLIGEMTTGPRVPAGRHGVAAEVTGTAEIALKRNRSIGSDAFSGHIYTVPLPA